MSSLQDTLDALSEAFALSVMEVLKSVTLDELMEGSDGAPIRKQLAKFSRSLADAALATVAHEEVVARPGRQKPGRLPRRHSDEDIAALVDRVVKLLWNKPSGMQPYALGMRLGLDQKEQARVLKAALALKKVTARYTGKARTYYAAGREPKPKRLSERAQTRLLARMNRDLRMRWGALRSPV